MTSFVYIAFPPGFVHPYTTIDKNGRRWNKAIITIPKNTYLEGHDIAYYNIDVFMNDHMIMQKKHGSSVVISLPNNQALELFKGRGEKRQTIIVLNPWKLAIAIKQSRNSYSQPADTSESIIKVTMSSSHLPDYTHPLTMPLSQADYELSRLEDLTDTLRFRYPATSNEVAFTLTITDFDGKGYTEKMIFGEDYHGASELLRSEYFDTTDSSRSALITYMTEETSRPLTLQQISESETRLLHTHRDLMHRYKEKTTTIGDQEYQQEVEARIKLDTHAAIMVNTISDELLRPYIEHIERQATNLSDARTQSDAAAEHLSSGLIARKCVWDWLLTVGISGVWWCDYGVRP